jgi:trans-2-enoyl-CoA reductase
MIMSKSLRCIALIVALMLVYGTATAKGYRWSCTYSEKASPAGIETDANLKLDFAFDDVTRKAIVLGNKGHSEVDVHIGSLAISFMEKLETGAVQTTVISFADDSTHSRHTLFSDKDLVPSQYYGQCTKQ